MRKIGIYILLSILSLVSTDVKAAACVGSTLTAATYADGDGIAGLFDTEYAYDLNGNITHLWRNGVYDRTPRGVQYGPIDDLTMEYDGNRLVSVADACAGPFYQGAYHFADGADEAVEYTYDANGNTVSDLNRGITAAEYDVNNRPRRVRFADGSQTLYLYDAAGLKRRTVHRVASLPVTQPGAEDASAPTEFVESVTDYCGGIVYEDSVIARINLGHGYLRLADNSGNKLAKPEYHFYHRDHLGNNRMDLDGTTGGVHQITHYYPYGMPMDCGYIPAYQRWLFGDKEFDRTSGLDLYDFEARAYDPALGRFRQPDPLAEKYRPLSPYLYCSGNPLKNIDPTGENIYSVDVDGYFHLEKANDDNYDRIYSPLGDNPYIDVKKSFMQNMRTYEVLAETSFSDVDNVTISVVNSYENMDSEYSFLKSNTLVEWSYVEMSDGNNKINYIGTTHNENSDHTQSYCLWLAKEKSMTITHATHNHTNENIKPSNADINMAKDIQDVFPNAKFTIVPSRQDLTPVNYDRNSNPNELEEVIIYAPYIPKK